VKPPDAASASVVITTKDRREDLRRALLSCVTQECIREIIVIDDGSSDGTSDMVRSSFREAVLCRFDSSAGYIVRRNYGARLAKSDIIVSIDDDARFSTNDTLARTVKEFESPRIGAVAIPYVNVCQDVTVFQRAPRDDGQVYLTATFIGTAHAVRRELFLSLGGYRECFVHQGEESDFCIRMLDKGYVCRLGNAAPIEHFESPRRDFKRMDLYGGRNQILSAWLNAPRERLPQSLSHAIISKMRWGLRSRKYLRAIQSAQLGIYSIFGHRTLRQPVSLKTYMTFEKIQRGSSSLHDVMHDLAKPAYC